MIETDDSAPTRADHVKWCKSRALEYVDLDDLEQAVRSMLSDLQKHPQSKDDAFARQTGILLLSERANAVTIRKWIEGFN